MSNEVNVIYNKETGIIDSIVRKGQKINMIYMLASDEFRESLGEIVVIGTPENLIANYKVENEVLVKLSNLEKMDLIQYGRFLTDDERVEKETPMPTQPSNMDLQNEIEELKGVIDIMLGVDMDGL